jgi:S-adenosylmethionine:tRNA ribosyltransferase-isomerase
MRAMRTDEFDFELPEALIAQFPLEARGSGRLLTLDGNTGVCADRLFSELPQFVREDDLFVFNDTRVIKARLMGARPSGGRVEALVERVVTTRRALAMLRVSHAPAVGEMLVFGGSETAVVMERRENFYLLEFSDDVLAVLERIGDVPLPPYIHRPTDSADSARYQTIYARHPGAVAAPTAGLHFDQAMMDRLASSGAGIAYVTLHVGAGTFQPVRTDEIDSHVMHGERYSVPEATARAVAQARTRGGRITAVGTTSLRALEAASQSGELVAGEGETRLFIRPGYPFRLVDRLLTNFHLPRSTLLMLVSAFAGIESVRNAYRHAIDCGYRFFSYGDAMLIDRASARVRDAA